MRPDFFISTRTWPGSVELEGSHVMMDSKIAINTSSTLLPWNDETWQFDRRAGIILYSS